MTLYFIADRPDLNDASAAEFGGTLFYTDYGKARRVLQRLRDESPAVVTYQQAKIFRVEIAEIVEETDAHNTD